MTEPSAPPVLDGDHEDQKPQSGFSAPAGFERFPKRKVALCVGYLGTNYSGLQRNPGVHSIDDDLEKALLEAGCISSNSVGKLDALQWSHAGRTDKGVHAVSNVISCKLMCPDNFLGRIQRALPADIRVFEAPVVMASFYAHGEADKRRYNYVLPLYALTPRSSTLPPRPAFTAPTAEDPSRTWTVPPPSQVFDYTSAPAPVWNDDLRGRFRRVLAEFVGSKSYHSFTPKGIPGADQCRRVITDITVSEEPISAGPGLPDYVIVGMTGQSFILNQIRKMIGLTVAIVRGDVEHQAAFPAVFDSKCNVPLAPGNGLFLKGVVFDRYETKSQKLAESKQGPAAEDPSKSFVLRFEASAEEREAFSREVVVPHILSVEKEQKEMNHFLNILDHNPPLEVIPVSKRAIEKHNQLTEEARAYKKSRKGIKRDDCQEQKQSEEKPPTSE